MYYLRFYFKIYLKSPRVTKFIQKKVYRCIIDVYNYRELLQDVILNINLLCETI